MTNHEDNVYATQSPYPIVVIVTATYQKISFQVDNE